MAGGVTLTIHPRLMYLFCRNQQSHIFLAAIAILTSLQLMPAGSPTFISVAVTVCGCFLCG